MTHQHSVSPAPIGVFDDHTIDVFENVVALIPIAQLVRGHVFQDGLFIQIVFDHFGHVHIYRLIISYTGANGVHNRDITFAIGSHNAGHTEHTGWVEYQGIEVFVIYPAIDHIHLLQTGGRFHVDLVVLNHHVAALDQLHTH